jgi:hypothetical protein
MTDATAALYGVTSFDERRFSPRAGRRDVWSLFDGIIFSVGAVVAACALVCAVTGAAIWIVGTALATHPNLNERSLIGPAAIALADPDLASAMAADVTGSIATSSDPAYASSFENKWSIARAPGSARTVALQRMPPLPAERESKVASLEPLVPAAPSVAAPSPDKRGAPQEAHNKTMPLPEPDSHTAVYDISAHTVYLPGGAKLEAHSGLGERLDDPRYVNVKDRGPTPPNVYELALREELFHEVRAIRLNPVGSDNMFGRDGMLAHSYMLGPNGQSNGCVSFKDYPAFLRAYLKGEVDRLVVVPHLGSTSWRTASARGPARADASRNP